METGESRIQRIETASFITASSHEAVLRESERKGVSPGSPLPTPCVCSGHGDPVPDPVPDPGVTRSLTRSLTRGDPVPDPGVTQSLTRSLPRG